MSVLLRERLAAAGIDPEGYSGHSLRAGFATSAAQAGGLHPENPGDDRPRHRRHGGPLHPRG
ncbi:hypothetical protein [Rhodobacter capsulatus]|uniref:hypothetical protein n=1 Tax=Rhodobacter capsulatus TaxID=1061 RepID=UPI004026C31B